MLLPVEFAGISKPKQKRTLLTEREQARLISRYAEVLNSSDVKQSTADLAEEFGVNLRLPKRLYEAAKMGKKPPASRKGVGGRPRAIGAEEAEMIESELRAHGQ